MTADREPSTTVLAPGRAGARQTHKHHHDAGVVRLRDPRTRSAEERARREREQIDNVVRKLDELRVEAGLSKYELGRRTHYHPMTITKLFTSRNPRPTLLLVVEIAEALGATVEITPARPGGVDLAATFLRELLRRTILLAAHDAGRDPVVDDEHLDVALHRLIAELAQASPTSAPGQAQAGSPKPHDTDGPSS